MLQGSNFSRLKLLCLEIKLEMQAMLEAFIDFHSIVFVVVPLLAFGFAHSFSKSGWTLIADLSQPIGVVVTVIGIVGILQNMSDPKLLPLAISISLLSIIYAIIVSGLTSTRDKEHSDLYSSGTKKGVATLITLGMLFWGMDAAAGIGAFLYLEAAISVLVGILLFILTDRLLRNSTSAGWGQRLLGIGVVFFIAGSIGMLVNLDDPRAMGPAMAWGILSLFYCLLLLIFGRLWFPALITDSNKNLRTDFLSFTLPFLIGIGFQVALLVLSFN
jgi:protein-S-isoprenylcysteine O-methyltransferase Ste14